MNELKIFQAKIDYNDSEGWVTLHPVIFAYSKMQALEKLELELTLPLYHEITIEEIIPYEGLII